MAVRASATQLVFLQICNRLFRILYTVYSIYAMLAFFLFVAPNISSVRVVLHILRVYCTVSNQLSYYPWQIWQYSSNFVFHLLEGTNARATSSETCSRFSLTIFKRQSLTIA